MSYIWSDLLINAGLLTGLLILLYVIFRKDSRKLRMVVLSYFTVLSLVFLIGLFQINDRYQLYDAPVDGGFEAKFNWVATFAYLYIIPLIILFSNKGFRRANDRFYSRVSRITVKVLLVAAFIAGGYIAMFGFVLTYYGFAP